MLPLLGHSKGYCTTSRSLLLLLSTHVTAQGQGPQVTAMQGQPQLNGIFTRYIHPQPLCSICSPLTAALPAMEALGKSRVTKTTAG